MTASWTVRGQASYQVQIQVTDDGAPNLSYTETLTIFVNDLKREPDRHRDLDVEQHRREHRHRHRRGGRRQPDSATDEDLPGDNFTYLITGGADQGVFNITGGNVLEIDRRHPRP